MHFYFISETNRETFKSNPRKYLPTYGGWCAWMMLEGDEVAINPKRYKIFDGKTH